MPGIPDTSHPYVKRSFSVCVWFSRVAPLYEFGISIARMLVPQAQSERQRESENEKRKGWAVNSRENICRLTPSRVTLSTGVSPRRANLRGSLGTDVYTHSTGDEISGDTQNSHPQFRRVSLVVIAEKKLLSIHEDLFHLKRSPDTFIKIFIHFYEGKSIYDDFTQNQLKLKQLL